MKGCTCAASSTSLRSGKVIPNTAALRPEATAAMMVFSIMFQCCEMAALAGCRD